MAIRFVYFEVQITLKMGQVPSSQLEDVTVTDTPAVLNADLICSRVTILNNTGKIVEATQYDNGVAGKTYNMPIDTYYTIEGIENANQVQVANGTDSSSITVPFRFYS